MESVLWGLGGPYQSKQSCIIIIIIIIVSGFWVSWIWKVLLSFSQIFSVLPFPPTHIHTHSTQRKMDLNPGWVFYQLHFNCACMRAFEKLTRSAPKQGGAKPTAGENRWWSPDRTLKTECPPISAGSWGTPLPFKRTKCQTSRRENQLRSCAVWLEQKRKRTNSTKFTNFAIRQLNKHYLTKGFLYFELKVLT